MSEANIVREAKAPEAPAPEAPADTSPGTGTITDIPDLFATYEMDQKRPYVADYFEAGDMWDKEPSLSRDLKEIEGYIRTQVEGKKIDNSTKAVSQYLKEMERKAGLTRYESTPQRIQKILAYVDFQKVVQS